MAMLNAMKMNGGMGGMFDVDDLDGDDDEDPEEKEFNARFFKKIVMLKLKIKQNLQ